MIQKLEAIGIDVNKHKWDDGSNQDDVAKIYVQGGPKGIRYIYFDYVKSGQVKEGSGHGFLNGYGFTDMFEIDHLKNEHLESVEGYYIEGDGIQAVQFKTNFKTSQLMGYYDSSSSKFSLAVKEKKIIGFHGSGNICLNSLGAYFNLISATRVKADGGKGGREWDDGSDHDNVSKIHVGGFQGLQFISFEYVKNGQGITGSIHGVSPRGVIKQTFVINHLNNEYLVSVEGYYDDVTGVIHGLQFTTNLRALDFVGNDKNMKKFSLGANGNRIIGFHGYAENSLNSLGVYFTTHTSNKLDLHGNPTGCFWDDGSSNDGIRKVLVYSADYLRCIRFEFNNGGKVEKTHRRRDLHNEAEFVLDYPNEFITSVEGTIRNFSGKAAHISTLIFKTSKGRTSPTFGRPPNDTKFLLEKKGNALVGFYGYYDHGTLNAIGAYYRPMPPPTNIIKLEAKGGEGGASWDDGGFNGVKRIFIGVSENTVAFIKFMYLKDAKMVFGNDHGNNLCGVQEFELNYPSEYLTSVEANYDEKSGVITMLKFVTNIKPSPNIGLNTTTSILHVHEKKNHKIVGFHGKSSNMLHQLGVHVVPL